jgi:hypothetical protein
MSKEVTDYVGLEHAVISDGKEKHDEYRRHGENRMMKHPIKGWFKDSTTGELEPFGEGIKQIHAHPRCSTRGRNW